MRAQDGWSAQGPSPRRNARPKELSWTIEEQCGRRLLEVEGRARRSLRQAGYRFVRARSTVATRPTRVIVSAAGAASLRASRLALA